MRRLRPLPLIGAAAILAYFFRFAGPGLRAGFASDDPMNIYYYWVRGPSQLARNLVVFFSTYGRPMGGVYYSALYHFFGLNPLPYHITTTCLLLVNTWLAFRFGERISGSQMTGVLCSLLVAYHAGLSQLVYMPSFIFDVLCFTFYLLPLNYYLSVRMSGRQWRKRQVAAFLLLYIAALESKEMAVTLPIMVLLYEAVWNPPVRWSWRNVTLWVRDKGLPGLAAGAVTAVFLAGKAFGRDSLLRLEVYRPVFTGERYMESTSRFLNTLFYQSPDGGPFGPVSIVLAGLSLLVIAWRIGQKHLLWMWLFIWITPLPVTFVPDRGGGCLYIPLAGWAVFAASILVWLTDSAGRAMKLQSAALAWTRRIVVLAAVVFQWALSSRQEARITWLKEEGRLASSVLEQIRALQPAVKPGARILVRNDVFDGYDTKFLFELTYQDPSVRVWLYDRDKLTAAAIERMDYIFTFENGTLKRLKGL